MNKICSLSFEEAINAIKDTNNVMYKHGVWNNYELTETKNVIKHINKSGYGADVSFDDKKNLFYVCIPADCDMW